MHIPFSLRVRLISFLSIAALAACLCTVAPATAAARGRADLQSSIGEESATAPLQEPVEETAPASGTPAESSRETRQEERRRRREERQVEREQRRTQRQEARGPGSCTIALQAPPRIITAGAPLTLHGTLSCEEGESAEGQTVTLYQKLARTPGFNPVGTATTEVGGAFQLTTAELEINSVFYVRAAGAKSLRTSVEVAPQVTLTTPAPGTQLLAGNTRARGASASDSSAVAFTGTVSPTDTGATVSLERQLGKGTWRRIGGGGVVDDEGGFTITEASLRAGEASLRVLVHSHGLYATAASTPVTYEISRRRSGKVTIQASSDPIAYGLGVTITGTVPGASGRSVTLLAQTGDGPFAPVTTTTTTGDEYSFSVSPLQNTRYRVTSASLSSAVLAEGVSFSLTLVPPATTVTVGEPVSFTGTVAPADEGQVVDLERENVSGLWHSVIASATVTSTGTYSIPYTFTTTGDELLRIAVPASSELQSAASEQLKLEVTAAP